MVFVIIKQCILKVEEWRLMKMMSDWKHIFKLDPAKKISDDSIKRLCQSETDAIIVGGTDNITYDGVIYLLSKLRRYRKPCILEISTMDALVSGFDYFFIPMFKIGRAP